MAVYFVEASALAKRYIAETGSMWLRALLDPSTGCSPTLNLCEFRAIIPRQQARKRGYKPCES